MKLTTFLTRFGINTTTNFDLKFIAKELGLDIKVLMRDEFQSSFDNSNTSFIINLQTSNENGSHWVLFNDSSLGATGTPSVLVPALPMFYYFDSYGIPPLKEVTSLISPLKYNTLQVQPKDLKICGQLCIWVLYRMKIKKEDFEDVILNLYQELRDLTA